MSETPQDRTTAPWDAWRHAEAEIKRLRAEVERLKAQASLMSEELSTCSVIEERCEKAEARARKAGAVREEDHECPSCGDYFDKHEVHFCTKPPREENP